MAGKETFLMNLDHQNFATFKDLSRWELPKTLSFSFYHFFKAPSPAPTPLKQRRRQPSLQP